MFLFRHFFFVSLCAALLAIGSATTANAENIGTKTTAPVMTAPEPLALGEDGAVPQSVQPLWLAPAMVLPATLLWCTLAFLRARRMDPNFFRRRARGQLDRLTARLAAAGQPPSGLDLELWCELTAKLLSLRRVAPIDDDVLPAIEKTTELSDKRAWRQLWLEAREALFSGRQQTPADWTARARHSLTATKIERATSVFPVLRAHWIPRTAALLVIATLSLSVAKIHATTAEEFYHQRKFAEAQAGWMDYLQTHPRDWAAHHNIALAAVQQEKWGLAQAHWTAAFLLAPRNPVVRENLQVALSRVDRVDPVLRLALDGNSSQRAVGYFSPGEWQEISWVALLITGAGLCAAVGGLYTRRYLLNAGLSAVVLGLIAAGAAVFALQSYGLLAQPNAACLTRQTDLRAIPSDLVEIQATAPLLAGTLVMTDGYYFGWSRILGRGNVVGWVRRDAVLPALRDLGHAWRQWLHSVHGATEEISESEMRCAVRRHFYDGRFAASLVGVSDPPQKNHRSDRA